MLDKNILMYKKTQPKQTYNSKQTYKPKLLFIHSEELLLKAFTRHLSDNYDVIPVNDPDMGYEAFHNYGNQLSAAIFNMGHSGEGIELAMKIRAENKKLPLIMMSGGMDDEIESELRPIIQAFVRTPIDFEDLEKIIDLHRLHGI